MNTLLNEQPVRIVPRVSASASKDSAPDFYGEIITMPRARVRLSARRQAMSDAVQALCFAAGANSIFYGEKLLTTANPDVDHDRALLQRLGMQPLHTFTA